MLSARGRSIVAIVAMFVSVVADRGVTSREKVVSEPMVSPIVVHSQCRKEIDRSSDRK